MSPHDSADCSSIMLRIQEFLDGEMGAADVAAVRAHLEACGACMSEYDRDRVLKALVRRSCVCEPAPERLRARIVAQFTQITVTHYREG